MAGDTLREVVRILAPSGRWVIVPGAVLSGRDPISRFIWWLYQITGQGDVMIGKGKALLERAGFSVKVAWEEAKGSRVLVVTADKVRKDHAGW
jgi:hypothetical protein